MRRIPQWIVRHARLILFAGAAITLLFAGQLRHLELDPSAGSLMLEGDPARLHYERVKAVFGTDSIIAVAIHRPDTIFRHATLAKIKQMAEELGRLDGVERVLSLATADNFADTREGVSPGPLYTDPPTDPEALAELRRRALANHTFVRNLVSPHPCHTAGLLVFVETSYLDRSALARRVREAIAADEPLPRPLLDDVLLSPSLARAVWASQPPPVREAMGTLAAAAERIPDAIGRAAHRLLRDRWRLRRLALREAPIASRRRTVRLVDGVDAVIARHRDDPAEEIYAVGTPVMKVRGAQHQRHDLSRLLPCTIVVVALVLFLAFRNAMGVLIPLGTVLVSVVWTFGLMALLGVPLTVITVIIGPLLIAVGNCYAMHLVASYAQHSASRREPRAMAEHALESCFLPVLLAGATTMVGFLSVTLSRLSSIREFGLFSAFGILCSLVVSLTIAPAVLRFLPRRKPREGGQTVHADTTDSLLRAIGRFDSKHGALVTVVGIVLVAVALVGCLFVRVNTNYIGFFHRNDPVRVHSRRLHEHLSGAVPLSVVLDARDRLPPPGSPQADEWRGPFTDPELLRFVIGLQQFIEQLRVSAEPDAPRAIDKTVSFADQVKLMHQGFSGDRTHELPATREAVEELLEFFYKRREAEKYVSEDFAQAHLYVRTSLTSSAVLGRLIEQIEAYGRERAPEGVRLSVTGENVLILRAADEIAIGQVRSLAIAFVVIFTLMGVLFTSVRAGLLSIIPNAIPIVGTFGLMGWLGLDLNAGTTLVASVVLGIAVDDTIHYMTGFNLEMRRLGSQVPAMLTTLYLRGRAIVFTSVALFFGFLVLAGSRFAPIVSFGCLTAVAMALALLGDLIVLPVLLRRVELVTLWDLLATRLPSDPGQWTGVLRGLRPAEARRFVLLSTLRRVARGATVLLRGADRAGHGGPLWAEQGSGRTLYAVLDGRVELRTGPDRRLVATLGPGQVFGEATPECGTRPPDVVAAEPTELLTIDEAGLRRLSRRYPRVAAKVTRNLVFLLADRLSHATALLLSAPPATAAPPPAPTPRAPLGTLARVEELAIRLRADFRSLDPGQRIALRGDAGRVMLVVVDGSLRVTAGDEGAAATAITVGRGDVLVGLPPESDRVAGPALPRAAEARAAGATRVIVVTEQLLDDLVLRRPRIAARWGLSLARILSRRLDETVDRLADHGGPPS